MNNQEFDATIEKFTMAISGALNDASLTISREGGRTPTPDSIKNFICCLIDRGISFKKETDGKDRGWQALANGGRYIDAIRMYRDIYNAGLKEAKDVVDKYRNGNIKERAPRKIIQLVNFGNALVALYDNGEIGQVYLNS
jgi:hypothetical protein